MTDTFRVGDLVECIRADLLPAAMGGPASTALGALYTISKIDSRTWGILGAPDGTGLNLTESPLPCDFFWGAEDFRLIHRPDARFAEFQDTVPVPVVA